MTVPVSIYRDYPAIQTYRQTIATTLFVGLALLSMCGSRPGRWITSPWKTTRDEHQSIPL